jgi:hypothetical protein
MKKIKVKLQLKKDTIRVLRYSELTTINGGTCLEPTKVGTQCVAVAYDDLEK